MPAFLSYSSEDAATADEIEEHLAANGIMVQRDRHSTRFGGDWLERVRPLIAESSHFVLLWSIHADKSQNVIQELLMALAGSRLVLPITLDETPVPGFLDRSHLYAYPGQLGEAVAAMRPPAASFSGETTSRVAAALNTVRLAGFQRFSSFQVLYPGSEQEIEESYVSLALVPGVSSEGAHTEYDALQLLRSTSSDPLRLLLLGHPGSGKTTTLQYVAHKLLSEPSRRDELLVFARCKEFRPHLHGTFAQFLYSAMRTYAPSEAVDALVETDTLGDVEQMILLDGLDELRPGTYGTFVQRLQEYLDLNAVHVSAVVVTTRIDSFRQQEADFLDWRRLSIKPLDEPRIASFVNRWFKDDGQSEAFLHRLEEPRFAELAARPFLLAMMCLVYERQGSLGKNRSEVLQLAAEYLEDRRQELTSDQVAQQRRSVLEELALRTLQMGMIDVDRSVAAGIATSRLGLVVDDPQSTTHALAFLDEIARETGLLHSSGSSFVWLHRSFQEYYAARCLKSLGDQEAEQILIEHAPLSWWEEPIRLYVGSMKAPVVVPLLRRLWSTKPALVLRSLTDVATQPAGLVRELLSLSRPADRVRMLAEFHASILEMDDLSTRRRIVVETVEPIFSTELDTAVLFHAIQLLQTVDADDTSELMETYFLADGRVLRERLENDTRMRFRFVPILPGEFVMGDNGGHDQIERPEHPVRITNPFEVQAFQLTKAAFNAINNKSGSSEPDDGHPAVDLSWYDAYMAALRAGCRLPTEAEWEYCARAGTKTPWFCGDNEDDLRRFANFEGDPRTESSTWQVGSGLPNPWGLFDVHGNVWEWCQDWLGPYEAGLAIDPSGPAAGDSRVRRGGGYAYHARGCRSAFRWGNDPSYRFKDIGVRLVAES